MPELTPLEQLELAKSHLQRVQTASWEPVDWADIGNYGLYALEAAVRAAAKTIGIEVKASHWSKESAARILTGKHGLPDVAALMVQLNETRKASNYGDVEAPELDAEAVAAKIEQFIDAVDGLVSGLDDDADIE